MPKICYVPADFGTARLGVVATANQILDEYAAQGYDLTLRQLYYQFVARGIIPNRDAEYKRLGAVVNDARLAGLIDWDRIEDRTRNLRSLSHWDSPASIVQACAEQFRVDLWAAQPEYLEVWVEKDALVGVLQVACEPLDVPHFSCRGYVSQSEMWAASQRLLWHLRRGQRVTVVHLGDHDPSGVDMTRDISDRLGLFVRHHWGEDGAPLAVDRIALTMEQVRRYAPPPNPAKVTDSRAGAYIEQYGDESWELDALEPAVLTRLIHERVRRCLDPERWQGALDRQAEGRRALGLVSARWERVRRFVEGGASGGGGT